MWRSKKQLVVVRSSAKVVFMPWLTKYVKIRGSKDS